ncbi:HXXEE domain-containing protein [Porphyromonas sp.]|uniref:HXXEE domain-containing protein n=1 Tax=Porphyromonas sp. TaxID=1924944 RepID=UPI0026DBA9AD|nr:HXXEE domain-containing protein [Porphyromonas sp.]MDO4695187.1 HXXEE domain-containing protein [Porphyromonas sp.]MDO4770933.1 HXXEE domain-containing protein [Porphyromonas sp.]
MKSLEFLMMILPVIFMLHDFEEIIMFENWLAKNRIKLKTRFPKIEKFIEKQGLFKFSTSTFAVGVLHEFILLSGVSLTATCFGAHGLWFAAFMAYFVHLFVHLGQWIAYRGYIPVIITTILTLPYCIYTFIVFWKNAALSILQMTLWGGIGVVIMIVTFPISFLLMSKFNQWQEKRAA